MTIVAGRCFNRGLENNVVTLKNDVIRIHSFGKDGLGIYRNETNDINKSSASFVMNLTNMIMMCYPNLNKSKSRKMEKQSNAHLELVTFNFKTTQICMKRMQQLRIERR